MISLLKCSTRIRVTFAVFLGCATGVPNLFAAEGPQCLVFTPNPTVDPTVVQGTVVNQCGKVVTGYMLTLDVTFADGLIARVGGGGEDFLMGTGAQPGSGLGPVQPGEKRESRPWTMTAPTSPSGSAVVTTVPHSAAVLFDDSTAVGDDQAIDQIFTDRRYAYRELAFWQQSLAKYKDEIVGRGPLARLFDLADVPARERAMGVPSRPALVRSHAEGFRAQLEFADGLVARGKTAPSEAVAALDAALSRQVGLLAAQSTRQTSRKQID